MTPTDPGPNDRLSTLTPPTFDPSAEPDDDPEQYLPRATTKRHWLTSILIYLTVWGSAFLVGVLVDRMFAG